MAKVTLNYKFNNNNSVEDTAEMLLKLFVEANKQKVEKAIKNNLSDTDEAMSHPA